MDMSSPPIIQASQPTPARPARKGAVFGGWVSLLVAVGSIFVPFPTFWLYGPLILAAFICGIVAIAQGKAGQGITLLICSLILPPIAMGIFWTAVVGAGSVLNSTNFWSSLTNKSPQQIVQAVAAAAESKDSSPDKSNLSQITEEQVITAHLNLPFKIDGVEILISGLRIGKLQKIPREFSYGSVPDKPCLLATVTLTNTTEGRIIYLQDVWGQATVTDNFGNVYNPSSLNLSRSEIQGAVSSQQLKPGEVATDIMIFETPLENAQKFTLSCDPNFFRSTGNGLLEQLSDKSFKLEFTRSDIK
jgi:hypothetical protein